MLSKTNYLKCDVHLAFLIRIVLFFAIPIIYMLFLKESYHGIDDTRQAGIRFSSRRPLGLVNEENVNCTPAAILEFPPDGLTRSQRQQGFIAVHCVLAILCFMLLSVVCEQYFVPVIKIICEKLEMAEDIAGATFMAAASSSPELFINCVGTFVTEGDLGVGAVVGSAVFNVLGVPACCALVSQRLIELDWWSVSRDCAMYAVAVVALILTIIDDRVYWYEALFLVSAYTLYILAMIFNSRIGSAVESGCCGFKKSKMYTEVTPLLLKENTKPPTYCATDLEKSSSLDAAHFVKQPSDVEKAVDENQNYNTIDFEEPNTNANVVSPGRKEKISIARKIFNLITWPMNCILWLTIPDCRKRPKFYPLTFIMCVCWIGTVSYFVAWIITIIGDTLEIPDSIVGLTILAAGTSLPEAVSSVVVTNQGYGSMGLSNSIGSNTFDILLCLGLPWLVKALFYPATPGNYWVAINSSGLSYSAISLLTTLLALYVALALNKFILDWRVGVTCAAFYVGFIILAILIELNVFFTVNLPICPHF